jgi:hypothetical protein
MRLRLWDEPRKYSVGAGGSIEISDFGEVELGPNEQLTFLSPGARKFDFTAKDWGFYATQSVNGRLKDEGFKTALVQNRQGRIYVMCVDCERMNRFLEYCESEDQTIIEWLDER